MKEEEKSGKKKEKQQINSDIYYKIIYIAC